MALVQVPAIGNAANKPVKLSVKISGHRQAEEGQGLMIHGLRKLYQNREFCDVTLSCAGQEFQAHKVVLSAKSEVFKNLLKDASEVRFAEIENPEALRWMLEYFYEIGYGGLFEHTPEASGGYSPASQAINSDVLRLALKYDLPTLRARATLFLTRELTTHNAVDRLATCDEFGLTELREKILEQLTANKRALAEVTSSPAITGYPSLMREMLALIAQNDPSMQDFGSAGSPGKKRGVKRSR